MSRKGIRSNLCSKCRNVKELGSKRYCRSCSNEWMREWRKVNPMKDFQRKKANVRCHTKMLVKRGTLKKLPCEICSDAEVQAHHEDYNNAYNVRWLCKKCHKDHHKEQSYDKWKMKQLSFNIT